MNKQAKIYIAGHNGMVGQALVRAFADAGYNNLLLRRRAELDLLNQAAVDAFFAAEKPAYVLIAAAKVGGIHANNSFPADFLLENLLIVANIIRAAHHNGVTKLLFLGSSCIYPKLAPQPLKEEYLLTSALEETNEAYAIAKIAGLKLCEYFKKQYGDNFVSVMPTNLYGPFDNFNLKNSHVLPALMRKMHEAKESNAPTVEIWGTGEVFREFLHVDDLASACLFLMEHNHEPQWLNIGSGQEVTIKDLAEQIKQVVGFTGDLLFNAAYPSGTPRKLLDSSQLTALGWQPSYTLTQGLTQTYAWFKENIDKLRDI